MGCDDAVGVGGVSVSGTGTCFAARLSVVVFGADICGRARTDLDGVSATGERGETGLCARLSARSPCEWENGFSFEGERGLFGRRKDERKSMLGERTDSASWNARVRPSRDSSDSGFSSDPTVVDDVSAVRDVSTEVDVSTVLNVSTLGRTLMDGSPGIGVAFRESRRGVFARLNLSWMGSGRVGSAGTGGGWSCAESNESCFLRDLEFSLKKRFFLVDSERYPPSDSSPLTGDVTDGFFERDLDLENADE